MVAISDFTALQVFVGIVKAFQHKVEDGLCEYLSFAAWRWVEVDACAFAMFVSKMLKHFACALHLVRPFDKVLHNYINMMQPSRATAVRG